MRRRTPPGRTIEAHDRRMETVMLRRMVDMPVGTIGFEAVGEVDDDWEEAVEPVLRQEIADGARCASCICSARRLASSTATR
jgi:hypothetical protein